MVTFDPGNVLGVTVLNWKRPTQEANMFVSIQRKLIPPAITTTVERAE